MFEWFLQVHAAHIPLSGPSLRDKAWAIEAEMSDFSESTDFLSLSPKCTK